MWFYVHQKRIFNGNFATAKIVASFPSRENLIRMILNDPLAAALKEIYFNAYHPLNAAPIVFVLNKTFQRFHGCQCSFNTDINAMWQ